LITAPSLVRGVERVSAARRIGGGEKGIVVSNASGSDQVWMGLADAITLLRDSPRCRTGSPAKQRISVAAHTLAGPARRSLAVEPPLCPETDQLA
jgi:hypothetical protein